MRPLESIVAAEKDRMIRNSRYAYVVIEKIGAGWGLVGETNVIAVAASLRDQAIERTAGESEIQIWKTLDPPVQIFAYIPGKKEGKE